MAQNYLNRQYTFQEFLLDCPYEDILIDKYLIDCMGKIQEYHVGYNFFDYYVGITRRVIKLSELDQIIDIQDDLLRFINDHRWIDELVIVDDRPSFDNPILSNYSINTLKSYLYRLNKAGISCVVARKTKEDTSTGTR